MTLSWYGTLLARNSSPIVPKLPGDTTTGSTAYSSRLLVRVSVHLYVCGEMVAIMDVVVVPSTILFS